MGKYSHTEEIKISDIVARISDVFKTEKERIDKNNYVYFDTFDWRLYKNNLFLTKNTSSYTISKLSNNDPLTSLTVNSKKNLSFWWEFPDCMLKNKLKKLIGVRSLIPLAAVDCKSQVFKVLNKDEKIVARLTLQNIKRKGSGGKEFNLICLNPVRGYHLEFKKLKKILSGMGLKHNGNDVLSVALLDTDFKPGSYSGKLNIKLKPEMTAQHATVLIFRSLLNTIKQNEEGIKKDIDTEFLHDFRVAVRRTRAALSQINYVFSENIINKAKHDFSILGKKTNLLRDFDVYHLKKERYIEMLPEDLRSGLEPVFKKLKTERKREQKKITDFLNSKSYKNIINSWQEFLENENLGNTKSKNSDVPVIEMAKKLIIKKYRNIIKAGKLINDQTPDTELHRLRIECKKLRYLLEFFASLFPKKEMILIINQLKKLQDNLGDFNDLYVQQESLKNFLNTIDKNKRGSNKVTQSVGGLIGVLYKNQQEVRNEFAKKFEEFSKIENVKLYNKLFS